MPNPGSRPISSINYLERVLPELARLSVKVASNAGGVNPAGCKRVLEGVIAELELSLRVAMVEGDDVMPLMIAARQYAEAVTGEQLPMKLLTANAYLAHCLLRQPWTAERIL